MATKEKLLEELNYLTEKISSLVWTLNVGEHPLLPDPGHLRPRRPRRARGVLAARHWIGVL
jgi:hypothetical protein